MVAVPIPGPDLSVRLAEAIRNYEASWKPVDSELYDLCRRRASHRDRADVYTKVAMIGRVYEAGVARAWRGDGDPETEIRDVLIERADLIERGLERLKDRAFGRPQAAGIVELHGHIARAISLRTKDRFLTSFVSKYLHFHCPIVPIYDSNARTAIGQLVHQDVVTEVRETMAGMADWATAYRDFVAAFVALYERANTETAQRPSVKELDHLLWQQ